MAQKIKVNILWKTTFSIQKDRKQSYCRTTMTQFLLIFFSFASVFPLAHFYVTFYKNYRADHLVKSWTPFFQRKSQESPSVVKESCTLFQNNDGFLEIKRNRFPKQCEFLGFSESFPGEKTFERRKKNTFVNWYALPLWRQSGTNNQKCTH